ncbi:hypothetical protein [Streptomyces sp. NPDC058874]|uniref:hypothetical protein n=1 Tax=Streptomyces TaxID=1883 RepID=UPI00364C88CB
MGAAILNLWVTHLGNTANSPADFTEIAIPVSALALVAWVYGTVVMRRVRSRLSAGSFSKEDRVPGVRRVPDGAIRTTKRAIAAGEEVHIVVSRRDRTNTLRVIDIPPLSSLAFVMRPRRAKH